MAPSPRPRSTAAPASGLDLAPISSTPAAISASTQQRLQTIYKSTELPQPVVRRLQTATWTWCQVQGRTPGTWNGGNPAPPELATWDKPWAEAELIISA